MAALAWLIACRKVLNKLKRFLDPVVESDHSSKALMHFYLLYNETAEVSVA